MKSLSIYIHIPFCLKKCDYCDFFSVPVASGEAPHEAYLAAITRQLEADAERLGLEGRDVGTIYFGGGTPSIMPPAFFKTLIAEISRHFVVDKNAEISCEVNPATADSEWFRAAREAGITRISVGVQSFSANLLKTLGRIHTSEDAMRAIAEAQDADFKSVSVDLMYAIPGETMADLEDDLRTAMTFQPEHISAYQLTLEQGTPLAEKYTPPLCKGRKGGVDQDLPPPTPPYKGGELLPDELQLKHMRTVARMLARGGWPRYEISNFAKPGFECRHNLNYWRYGEYLGLGAGATSFIRDAGRPPLNRRRAGGTRDSKDWNLDRVSRVTSHESRVADFVFARRFTQIRDIAEYIAGTQEFAESEELDTNSAMGEFCFMNLRTTEGVSRNSFQKMFKTEFDSVYGETLADALKMGLLEEEGDRIFLTQKGLELSNQVFERFL